MNKIYYFVLLNEKKEFLGVYGISCGTYTLTVSVSNVKTVKEQKFHYRSTNVPVSNRNEIKTFEFVPKIGLGEQILDQIETVCFQ